MAYKPLPKPQPMDAETKAWFELMMRLQETIPSVDKPRKKKKVKK